MATKTAKPPKKDETKKPMPKKEGKPKEPKTPKEGKPKGGVKKEGLRGPQVRLLQALDQTPWLTRKEMCLRAGVDVSSAVEYIGSMKDEIRLKNDAKHFPCLITLKYVRFKEVKDGDSTDIKYEITGDGKKAMQKAIKEMEASAKD